MVDAEQTQYYDLKLASLQQVSLHFKRMRKIEDVSASSHAQRTLLDIHLLTHWHINSQDSCNNQRNNEKNPEMETTIGTRQPNLPP